MMTRYRSRHRLAPARLSLPQRLAASALLVTAAGVTATAWPAAARADAPIQTGWWNMLSAGGQAAPDPAAPSGGLHISAVPGHILAYGAVLYSFPAGGLGTLELKVSVAGAPNPNPTNKSTLTQPSFAIEACPTTHAWQGGDDQATPGPTYDCTHGFTGAQSSDQSTLTFLVDDTGQQIPGQLSLAIVPVLTNAAPVAGTPLPFDATEPFTADIAKPDDGSLVLSASYSGPAPAPGVPGSPTVSSGPAGGGSSAPPSSYGGVPGGSTSVATPTGTGAAPVVAPSGTTTAPAAAPAAAATASTDDTGHNVALAMLLLLAMWLALAANQRQREPQQVGRGRYRNSVLVPPAAAAPDAGAADAGAAAGQPAATQPLDAAALAALAGYGARGLGRFAKPRLGPPRPLV